MMRQSYPSGYRYCNGWTWFCAAIEAADIVLMDDDPSKIALAMRISKKNASNCASEYRFCTIRETGLPDSRSLRHCKHVACHFR